jgi:hypothetical protein
MALHQWWDNSLEASIYRPVVRDRQHGEAVLCFTAFSSPGQEDPTRRKTGNRLLSLSVISLQ